MVALQISSNPQAIQLEEIGHIEFYNYISTTIKRFGPELTHSMMRLDQFLSKG